MLPAKRKFHPVTSTLFILAWGLTALFAVSALAFHLASIYRYWAASPTFAKTEL